MKNKHSLSVKQAKYLLSIIFIAMVFKVITVKDIQYENGKINHIDGIEFEKKKIILLRDVYNIETNFNSCILIEPNLMSYNWDKYLITLKKLIL